MVIAGYVFNQARLNVGFFLGGIKCYTVRRQCHTLKGVVSDY